MDIVGREKASQRSDGEKLGEDCNWEWGWGGMGYGEQIKGDKTEPQLEGCGQ